MKKASLALLVFFLSFLNLSLDLHFNLGLNLWAQESPRVEKFTPQGTVKNVRQVRAQFSEPMVPFGDPRDLAEPFILSCPQKGTARWADGKNWVYDFEKDLPAGIQCEFTLQTGLKALSGREVAGPRTFAFSTGGPAIKESIPNQGDEGIDEDQVFVLRLDAEPNRDSVLQQVSFSVEGLPEGVGIRLVEGKEREKILESSRARWISRDLKTSGHSLLLLQSRQRFPHKAKVNLVWGRGVLSKTGVATERDQVLPFKTRDAFSVSFRCQRENPRAACLPITPMALDFSAPVPAEWAGRIVLKGPGEKIWKPQLSEEERESFTRLSFKGPFPEKASFIVELP